MDVENGCLKWTQVNKKKNCFKNNREIEDG